MTIAALLIGLTVGLLLGALGVAFGARERLRSAAATGRDAATRVTALDAEARELERRAVQAEAQLAAERGTLDERVASAVKTASAAAMKESSGAFLDLAQTKLDAY